MSLRSNINSTSKPELEKLKTSQIQIKSFFAYLKLENFDFRSRILKTFKISSYDF